ncbi:MAG: dTDP-4-dehydrorhamnose 3,5-epimerase [Bdellovibrionales bacterium]|nr:dTDP-4-dehydrorhamnose 3,5-epimerase [Bdellovibrionales bacterium]
MKFIPTNIPEVIIVEPKVFQDERGFFLESFQAEKYAEGGITGTFVQDNHSLSKKGILRGMHSQKNRPQGKLVRVVEGEVFDVAVDIRPESPTYKQWVGVTLSAKNFRQLWVPPGFAHGFCVLSEQAQFEYKCTDFYFPNDELGFIWNDPEINIDWPIKTPSLSAKDQILPTFSEIESQL